MNQSDISHALMIRFGLPSSPDDDLIRLWFKEADSLIKQGYTKQNAGEKAASKVFPGYNTRVYEAQADTIESLLDQAGSK